MASDEERDQIFQVMLRNTVILNDKDSSCDDEDTRVCNYCDNTIVCVCVCVCVVHYVGFKIKRRKLSPCSCTWVTLCQSGHDFLASLTLLSLAHRQIMKGISDACCILILNKIKNNTFKFYIYPTVKNEIDK